MSELKEHYIDNQADFERICSDLAGSPYLALDTEFERRNTYYPILALLQIADQQNSVLIDPLKIQDWHPFRSLLASQTVFVMHSCSEDLEVFRKHLGGQPAHLMDTQIACAFLGKGDALGYANMVMAMRQVEIDKSETRSDWLKRPLTGSQQTYAREDVRWLLGICAELEAELTAAGRLAWVQQECAQLRDKYWREPDIGDQWLRIKGLGRIDSAAWPLAYALSSWREGAVTPSRQATRLDYERPGAFGNFPKMPKNKQELARIKGVTSVTLQRNQDRVLALTNANDLPTPEITPMPELTQEERNLLKRCQQLVADKAEQLQLSARFIASKQELSELIHIDAGRSDSNSSLDSGWRYDLIGKELKSLLANA